ncbi:Phospho-N-acetylmuramoyl-pentapeptide-transferase [Aliarcobacter thereius]|uniref:Phospho-N-acetylmuramoyl-pentapeptide-transferase n=2 Tax=Aliarcobacter thereius TaxID=544718 RepID=A0A1C0B815_9BACT|nr:phospho-N-acetylmuramoyl-pentapeptide-transferase [Aliarcobacter thereius]OCL87783.1 Phospho-N-acetylmuramoyl-pentapeptide-transferase [Aliarcobacter thereius]OCL94040.1 Phospho-N-acetylmuramoyl-pentapeptide-transferase [Aliarcobacter thereius]OCL95434.1 Phospho-N-acetylmuramoyl-pentapeptide-transferase [Aliarcobacter thereius LMG 24486]OCL99672.1 Phospho-N-acetylmuramoyl-pentapeptide-transferase [Aliarcobacter thereius]QBF16578.1 phospho-N-acetylmuramoyl-pentapeptide transferase [Aliarcoba
MFYWFYRHLDINIFQYISVRAGISFFVAFILTMYLMPKFIKWAKSKNASQPIYELAPENHKQKAGTPTMGGVVFIFSAIIATLLTAKLNNFYVYGGLLTLALFSLIGIQDDYKKITKAKNSEGLSARMKLLFQFLSALIVVALIYYLGHTSSLYVPFYKYPIFEMGIFSIVFWMFIIVGSSNAVNLTDGLDGLATVPSILAFSTLSVLVYIVGHTVFANYLLLPSISIAGELAILGAAIVGSLIAFLWFNAYPAEVFMGDSGSLPLGALMGFLAIVSKSEILLLLIGFIFVLETVSVMLQVGSYKLRQKRVFLMAPIHHHFEQKGWKENKIIVRFWIIAFMSNLIALLSLKLR